MRRQTPVWPESEAAGLRETSVLSAQSDTTSIEEVWEFILAQYGLDAALVKLSSERDDCYHVTTADGMERLFKLTHPAEDRSVVDFETKALLHVHSVAPALPVPRLVRSVSSAYETTLERPNGCSRQGRMFTYLAGAPLSGFRQTSTQATRLGILAAQLDIALSTFRHPAAGRELLWDITHARSTRELLTHTHSKADRDLCKRAIDHFERHAVQILAGFRRQVIHNDLTPHNVLASRDDADEPVGIIDFGDMVHAPLVNEVAVASSYLVAAGDAPLGTVPEFVSAYHSINPLEAEEIDVLPTLISVRHAITIAISNWRAARYPENRDYILKNHESAVVGLQKIFSLREGFAREQLMDACSPTTKL